MSGRPTTSWSTSCPRCSRRRRPSARNTKSNSPRSAVSARCWKDANADCVCGVWLGSVQTVWWLTPGKWAPRWICFLVIVASFSVLPRSGSSGGAGRGSRAGWCASRRGAETLQQRGVARRPAGPSPRRASPARLASSAATVAGPPTTTPSHDHGSNASRAARCSAAALSVGATSTSTSSRTVAASDTTARTAAAASGVRTRITCARREATSRSCGSSPRMTTTGRPWGERGVMDAPCTEKNSPVNSIAWTLSRSMYRSPTASRMIASSSQLSHSRSRTSIVSSASRHSAGSSRGTRSS